MMEPDWSLASVKEARAFHFGDCLAILIVGEFPDPCHSVDIERNLLTIEPPEFIARWYVRQGPCPDVVTPYAYQEVFRVGAKRESVKLHHADGVMEIAVEDSAQQPILMDQAREATGYSDAFDFAEAFRNAISQLPEQGGGIPDWLSRYEVVSIGAEIGGIANFNRMYVRARGEE